MRLQKIQNYFKERKWEYQYNEVDGCGSIDWIHRGLKYHIWEFMDAEPGAESNILTGGHQEDFLGDYEEKLLQVLRTWQD